MVNTSSKGEILTSSKGRSFPKAGQHQLKRGDPCIQLVNTSSKGEILINSKEEILINICISTAALISYL
jgi:hypothetical protein